MWIIDDIALPSSSCRGLGAGGWGSTVPSMVTMSTSRRSFRHLEHQDPSIISEGTDKNIKFIGICTIPRLPAVFGKLDNFKVGHPMLGNIGHLNFKFPQVMIVNS